MPLLIQRFNDLVKAQEMPSNLDGLLSLGFPIPTGLKHQAQGCEERATLGKNRESSQPRRGWIYVVMVLDSTPSGL